MGKYVVTLEGGTKVTVEAGSPQEAQDHVSKRLSEGWNPVAPSKDEGDDRNLNKAAAENQGIVSKAFNWATGGDKFDKRLAETRERQKNDKNWYDPALRVAKDAGNILADSTTFGLADKAVAGARSYINDTPYDDELQRARASTAESMKAPGATQLALAGGIAPAKAVAGAYNMLRLPKVGGWLGSIGAGAGFGAINEAGHTDGGLSEYLANMTKGGIEGGVLGLLTHGLVKGVGATAGAPAAGEAPRVRASTRRILNEAGATDAETTAARQRLGPEATLAEGDTRLKDLSAATVASGGPAATPIVTSLRDRAAGTAGRIADDVDAAVGSQLITPDQAREALQHARRALGPDYQRIFAAGGPVDVRSVVNMIDSRLRNPAGVEIAKGPERATLLYARNLLVERAAQPAMGPTAAVPGRYEQSAAAGRPVYRPGTPGTPGQPGSPEVLVSDPTAVQSVKRGINRQADPGAIVPPTLPSSGERVDQGVMRDIGQRIRTAMSSVPGYDALSARAGTLLRRSDHIQHGEKIFDRNVPPEDLAARDQPGVRVGARAAVRQKFGNANDAGSLTELETMVNKPWNQQKIANTFGQEAADRLTATAGRERTFAQNRADIAQGSHTAGRLAARDRLQTMLPVGDMPKVPSLGEIPGRIWHAARRIGEGTLTEAQRSAARSEIGQALSLKGVELDRFISQLTRDVRAVQGQERGVSLALPGLLNQTYMPSWDAVPGLLNPHQPSP